MKRHSRQPALGLYSERSRTREINKQLEKDIQKACMDWLNSVPGVTVWRQNTGASAMAYTDKSGNMKQRFVRFGEPGQCDTTGIVNGLRLEIEIKRPGGVLNDNQGAWIQMVRDRGGIAFWCDSLRSCVGQMKDEFLKRGWRWRVEWEIR